MGRPRRRAAGVVDPDGNRAAISKTGLQLGRQMRQVARVGLDEAVLLTLGGRQLPDQFGEFVFIAGQGYDLRPLSRQLPGTGSAQALAGSRSEERRVGRECRARGWVE